MKSRSEKTQPGNPHRLTLRQHVFPTASINRFTGSDGRVELVDLRRTKFRRARPDDTLLYADRAWSHHAEAGYMKRIEDEFQALAQQILFNTATTLTENQQHAAMQFYALWQARAERRHLPAQTVKPTGVMSGSISHSSDDLERLEKAGITTVRSDGSLAYRDINGAAISVRIGMLQCAMSGEAWGIVTAADGEFCVPDTPAHGILPLSPSICLIRNTLSSTIARGAVGAINAKMLQYSTDYFLARSLANCPCVPQIS